MKPLLLTAIVAASLLSTVVARAAAPSLSPKVGNTYEITLIRESSEQEDGQSTGSAYDKDTLVERVVSSRADGLELEYDFPKEVTADERRSNWQFPVRVFKPISGPMRLLNGPELEARVDAWLKAAGWPRTICGHWIFTWNAFRIECDPLSVIKTVEAFDLRGVDLREGASYQESDARSPGTLVRKTVGAHGAIFSVEMQVDPDAVRHDRAASDVAVGEIMRKPVTIDAALRDHANETVSGTISVTFETDSDGNVRRRTKMTQLQIKKVDGKSEVRNIKETLERRLILRPN